ncbi:MAG: Methylase involved in ubiquinone/menaquinone biosynthesis [Candidatus Moranbacteria bacterium GW2011_GWA2_39_41]|nr:MAG: Methylase involved in ubiquinone/menaquinone biosynthesis [Candidatus Moranbacteria bacterium GW2011_GWA2_39_41]
MSSEMNREQSFSVKFINPEAVVEKLDLLVGGVVADFGCGSGFFSLPIAEKIGEHGVVYALDILPQNLETIASRAKTAGITNIVTKRVNLEKDGGSRLPDASCDWVIMKDMLFQNKNKLSILSEGRRVLKDGGKILLIEWNFEDASIGPDRSLRISKEALTELVQQADLSILNEISVSNFHYGLILVK